VNVCVGVGVCVCIYIYIYIHEQRIVCARRRVCLHLGVFIMKRARCVRVSRVLFM
jgi:hypothetical protein